MTFSTIHHLFKKNKRKTPWINEESIVLLVANVHFNIAFFLKKCECRVKRKHEETQSPFTINNSFIRAQVNTAALLQTLTKETHSAQSDLLCHVYLHEQILRWSCVPPLKTDKQGQSRRKSSLWCPWAKPKYARSCFAFCITSAFF